MAGNGVDDFLTDNSPVVVLDGLLLLVGNDDDDYANGGPMNGDVYANGGMIGPLYPNGHNKKWRDLKKGRFFIRYTYQTLGPFLLWASFKQNSYG